MEWINPKEQLPATGQRVLVWDRLLNESTIAYYTPDNQFEEWQNGVCRTINLADWWMPLPPKPPINRLIPTPSGGG